jgi:predicted N-formylglutamate amidohydrolase
MMREEALDSAVERTSGAMDNPLLILCDHASNFVPPQYDGLGLPASALQRHIAFDPGALEVAASLAGRLNATLIASHFSRLLIDPNRGEDDPTLIMQISDGAVIPGNARLSEEEREARRHLFYDAYHGAISTELDAMIARGLTPIILSLHSFTAFWRGKARPWHCGILWDRDPRLALPLLDALRAEAGLLVGDNEPYSGRLKGDCLYRHGTSRGLPHALVEIRQDLIGDERGQAAWAKRLAEAMRAVLDDAEAVRSLSQVAFFGSHADL